MSFPYFLNFNFNHQAGIFKAQFSGWCWPKLYYENQGVQNTSETG